MINDKQPPHAANDSEHTPAAEGPSMTLEEAELLSHDLRKLLVRSEHQLMKGDVRHKVEQLERWVESYRRGLSAAQKITHSGVEMLAQARNQLHLALEEQLRLEDEGGNVASKEQSEQLDQLTAAIRRMDRLIPVVEGSFQSASTEAETTTKKPEAA